MHWAITGGTGFLGIHVLRELLRGSGTFTLLTRPRADPIARIQRVLAGLGEQVWTDEQLRERLAVLAVDLAEPNLGLPDQRFKAFADRVDAVLHCAGSVELDGDLAALRRVNVDGTARILELAQAGSREPDLFHVSTAYVAGRRRTGIIYETEFGNDTGFENNYERSKFEAETLVRDWAQRTGRRVVVLRPGILVSDRPPDPDFPLHPLSHLSKTADPAIRLASISGQPLKTSLSLRVTGDSNGHLNYMPVGEAAEAMVRLLRLAPDGLSTYHVVHRHDVAVPTLMDLLNAVLPIRLSVVDGPIENPNVLEKHVRSGRGFMPYLQHSRTFDTTGARAILGEPTSQTVVDFELSARRHGAVQTTLLPRTHRAGIQPVGAVGSTCRTRRAAIRRCGAQRRHRQPPARSWPSSSPPEEVDRPRCRESSVVTGMCSASTSSTLRCEPRSQSTNCSRERSSGASLPSRTRSSTP